MPPLELNWTSTSGPGTKIVPMSAASPWCSMLGDWELPDTGTIDQLDAIFADLQLEQITLNGCPSASLLVVLWIRSIWGQVATRILLDWDALSPELCSNQQRLACARLACLLADDVLATDTDMLGDLDPKSTSPEESIDLMSYLMDAWDPSLHLAVLGEDWTSSMKRTITKCVSKGHRRLGIYGAGTHTRSIGDALMAPPATICCIIDDDQRQRGEHLWGYPIVSPDQALGLELDAVILSANSIEDRLWDQASVFRDAGIETIRIYGPSD